MSKLQIPTPLSRPLYLARVVAGANVSNGLAPRHVQPIGAHLLLTENCQARCVTCDYWKSRWTNFISTELAIETINRLSEVGIRYLRFTGGEPLLRRDLWQILGRAATGKYTRIRLQTNGLLLRKRASDINASAITDVTISLDSTGELNDQLRGVAGYYERAIDGASKLEGKRICIACTLTGPGADDLEALIEVTQNSGWSFSYNLLNNNIFKFRGADLTCWPDKAALDKILEVLRGRLGRPEYELTYVRKHYEGGPSRRFGPAEPPCVLGYMYIYITSNGDIFSGCYSLPRVGNILRDDIRDVVRSKAYQERCRSMLRRECDGCTCNIFMSLDANNPVDWIAHRISS